MKKGFEGLGYEVDEYNYRTKLKQLGFKGMCEDFVLFGIGRDYDLQVFCKTNQMDSQLLNYCKVTGKTWYWFMDNMEVARAVNASAYAQNATFASATASDVADRFGMVNKNSYHIFEGYDPDVYFYEDIKKIHDVIFIGNATVPRIIQINNLRSAGVNVTVFGQGWPFGMKPESPVFGEDERTEINQSKIVLNLCHDDVIFSDRVVKALACGADVISQPCKDLLFSSIGENLHMFTCVDSFRHVAKNITGVQSQASKNKADHMKEHYSWEAVCKGILEKAGV